MKQGGGELFLNIKSEYAVSCNLSNNQEENTKESELSLEYKK